MKRSTLILILVFLFLAVFAAIMWVTKNPGSFGKKKVFDDFNIEDTSAIDRMVISDYLGGMVELVRSEDGKTWWVKDKYRAKDHSVKIALKTFCDMQIKGKVSKSKRDKVISSTATKGKRVDVYSEGEKLKSYLIGTCTQDQKGTYMILEHADGEVSDEPFVMQMKKFTGCLRQRFFTENDEWRYTGIFEYPHLNFKEVQLVNNVEPKESFSIVYNGGNDITLLGLDGNAVPVFDTLAVKDYLLLFKKVHFETYQSYLTPAGEDSLNRELPAYTFKVIENDNEQKKVDLFFRPPVKDYVLPDSTLAKIDMERYWGRDHTGEIGLCQTYVFNPMTLKLSDFLVGDN